MEYLLLGLGIGLVTVLPPGPISLTLLHVGSHHGTRAALRGAAGVASGDTITVMTAAAIVAAGTMLPHQAVGAMRAAGLMLVAAIGLVMLASPGRCDRVVSRIERPGRTLFLATALTPSVLPSWIAIVAAMPFSASPSPVALFAAGIVVATALWHSTLGLVSGRFGSRVTTSSRRRITRLGGAAMVALAAVLSLGV